jgi:YfiH family protein
MTIRHLSSNGAQIVDAGGIPVLSWQWLYDLGVEAVVTTREGGVSTGPYRSLNLGMHVGDDPDAVVENRRRAAGAIGATVQELVFANQVHGTRVTRVGSEDAGRGSHNASDAVQASDALVTTEAGPVLVTLVADCSPLLLFDPEARVLATVHAGWRGAVDGTVRAAVEAMANLGALAGRTVAVIGPTVSPSTYVVGHEVAVAARGAFGRRADEVLWSHGDRWRFDVAGANRLQLLSAGVLDDAIASSPFTTGDESFFSDRDARPCGRFGLLARMR